MRCLILAALLVSLFAPVVLAEPDEGASARLRIATFDLGRAEKESTRKQEGVKAIEARFATERADFAKLQAEYRRCGQEFRNSIYRAGSPEHQKQLAHVRDLDRAVKEKGLILGKRIGAAKTELLRAIYSDLEKAVTALAEKESYDLVLQVQKPSAKLEAGELARQLNATAVFFAHPRFDITDRVIEGMNRAHAAEKEKAAK
jgi:Skp family chaperone for outer membrane proteins